MNAPLSWATEDLRAALVGLVPDLKMRVRSIPNNALAKPLIALFDAIEAAPGLGAPPLPHAPVAIAPADRRLLRAWPLPAISRDATLDLLSAARSCLSAELARRAKLTPGAPAWSYCEARIQRVRAAIAGATVKPEPEPAPLPAMYLGADAFTGEAA